MPNENCNCHGDCVPIKGICCEVDNCKYNNGNSCCTAGSITVKNKMALMGEETMCDTFEEM